MSKNEEIRTILAESWKPLESCKMSPEVMSVHCDTRDFSCLLKSEDWKDKESDLLAFSGNEEYLISGGKVFALLGVIQDFTGGKIKWRMLNYAGYWDLKYIRFFRVSDNKFLVTARDAKHPLPVAQLNSTFIHDS